MTRIEPVLPAHGSTTSSGAGVGISDDRQRVLRTGIRRQGTLGRAALGFAAGALSHLTLQSGLIAILYTAGGPVPFAPWSMAPVPPFGVPATLSAAFFGGLWGIVYALLEPRLTGLFGRWLGGVVFGALPLLVLWFVALPLKGFPIGGGFDPMRALVAIVLHAGFGLGVAIIFWLGMHPSRRSAVP